jgi:hypothetical protein
MRGCKRRPGWPGVCVPETDVWIEAASPLWSSPLGRDVVSGRSAVSLVWVSTGAFDVVAAGGCGRVVFVVVRCD